MGSTKAGAYFLKLTGEEDWEYYAFRPVMGMEFCQIDGDYYEAVFVRKPEFERWQQIFQVYPELEEFSTSDLFAPHPTKPGRWKYVGRTDDLFILSHGECVYAPAPEDALLKYPGVAAVLVGGQGRPRPFVILHWKNTKPSESDNLQGFWEIVDGFNKSCSDLVRLSGELILFTDVQRPLARTAKGTIARREAEKLFAEDIKARYT